MRDPARIPEILHKLGVVWKRNPDMRLGQLLINIDQRYEGADGWFIEDDDLLIGLNQWLAMNEPNVEKAHLTPQQVRDLLDFALNGSIMLDDFMSSGGRVHSPAQCEGQGCPIHNPSNHHMKGWPRILRESTLIERRCSHGIGHPDPDSVAYLGEQYGVHGCDGCCTKEAAVH